MQLPFVIIILGILVALSSSLAKRKLKAPLAVSGVAIILSAPWYDAIINLLLPLAICGGFLLFMGFWIYDTNDFFMQTQDSRSNSPIEFLLFGFYKWDNFLEGKFTGLALMCAGGLLVLTGFFFLFKFNGMYHPGLLTQSAPAVTQKSTKHQTRLQHRANTPIKPVAHRSPR